MSSRQNNPRSKKAQQEKNKNPPNNPKMVKFDQLHNTVNSGAESPDEAAPVAGTKQATLSQDGISSSAKRTKTSTENAMEIDLETSLQNSFVSAEKSNSQ